MRKFKLFEIDQLKNEHAFAFSHFGAKIQTQGTFLKDFQKCIFGAKIQTYFEFLISEIILNFSITIIHKMKNCVWFLARKFKLCIYLETYFWFCEITENGLNFCTKLRS